MEMDVPANGGFSDPHMTAFLVAASYSHLGRHPMAAGAPRLDIRSVLSAMGTGLESASSMRPLTFGGGTGSQGIDR